MDIYNRWMMRASGERRHQAQSQSEAATFAALSVLLDRGMLPATEADRSALADALLDRIGDHIEAQPVPLRVRAGPA